MGHTLLKRLFMMLYEELFLVGCFHREPLTSEEPYCFTKTAKKFEEPKILVWHRLEEPYM